MINKYERQVIVTPEKLQELEEKFKALKIQASDITQKADITSTVVYLKHIPTGIEVKCKKSPEPKLNYFLARQMLAYKIEEKLTGVSDRMREFEKIRKRKARAQRKSNQKWME